ncbi:hypothetical protein [Microbispora sp. GKU 823]|uniref:hypothetical protein n=1 Tax=Microbispora sp. GKU 823 TaxID=1652100 RepID=UPI003567A201
MNTTIGPSSAAAHSSARPGSGGLCRMRPSRIDRPDSSRRRARSAGGSDPPRRCGGPAEGTDSASAAASAASRA